MGCPAVILYLSMSAYRASSENTRPGNRRLRWPDFVTSNANESADRMVDASPAAVVQLRGLGEAPAVLDEVASCGYA